MTAFKVGDKVRVIKKTVHGDWPVGTVGTVYTHAFGGVRIEVDGQPEPHQYPYLDYFQLELVHGMLEKDTKKECPVTHILQYELDKDPFETFGSMKEVEARIKELAKRPDLKCESIKVYEIAKTYDVSLETRVIFGGTKVRIEAAEPHTKRKYVRSLNCSTCGRICKDKRGLGVHEARTHKP